MLRCSILCRLAFSSSGADGGRTGGPEAGSVLLSTFERPLAPRSATTRVHVLPQFGSPSGHGAHPE
eukprot:5002405-Prymnesium_polylepis.1